MPKHAGVQGRIKKNLADHPWRIMEHPPSAAGIAGREGEEDGCGGLSEHDQQRVGAGGHVQIPVSAQMISATVWYPHLFGCSPSIVSTPLFVAASVGPTQ